jgi:hypothetical protein
MCNLYSLTKGQAGIRQLALALRDIVGTGGCVLSAADGVPAYRKKRSAGRV